MAFTVTHDFTAGIKAKASEVNTNFADIESEFDNTTFGAADEYIPLFSFHWSKDAVLSTSAYSAYADVDEDYETAFNFSDVSITNGTLYGKLYFRGREINGGNMDIFVQVDIGGTGYCEATQANPTQNTWYNVETAFADEDSSYYYFSSAPVRT